MGKAAPAASALVFSGGSQSGEVRAIGTAVNGRYDRYSYTDLVKEGLYRKFSSATLYAPGAGATVLLLFGDTYSMSLDSYNLVSRHLQLTNNSGAEWDVELSDFDFNDQTDQVLLVHTQRAPETRVSLSQGFQQIWGQVTQSLPPEVELDGDPTFGWAPFIQSQGLKDKLVYLTVQQSITAVLPWFWSNYAASLEFKLRIRAKDGNAIGGVATSHYWIERGPMAPVIKAIVDPNLQLLVQEIDVAIDSFLSGINSLGTVTDVYFLPGAQTTLVGAGDVQQAIRQSVNDVTIVFEGVSPP